MTRLVFLAAALFTVAAPCMAADPPLPFSAFFGTWKVAQLAGAASITESQQSADAAIGTEIYISADQIATYSRHDNCRPSEPKVTQVDTAQLLQS